VGWRMSRKIGCRGTDFDTHLWGERPNAAGLPRPASASSISLAPLRTKPPPSCMAVISLVVGVNTQAPTINAID